MTCQQLWSVLSAKRGEDLWIDLQKNHPNFSERLYAAHTNNCLQEKRTSSFCFLDAEDLLELFTNIPNLTKMDALEYTTQSKWEKNVSCVQVDLLKPSDTLPFSPVFLCPTPLICWCFVVFVRIKTVTQPPLAKLPPEAGMQAKCEEEEVGGRGGGVQGEARR